MKSKIFTGLIIAGLAILIYYAFVAPVEPVPTFYKHGDFAYGIVIKEKGGDFLATYMPWLGLVSTVIGFGEKIFKFINWITKRRT